VKPARIKSKGDSKAVWTNSVNNGNSKFNPNSINKISMLHLANPANGAGSTKIDCIMFTEKGPLEL
jgi:hypothetical protein